MLKVFIVRLSAETSWSKCQIILTYAVLELQLCTIFYCVNLLTIYFPRYFVFCPFKRAICIMSLMLVYFSTSCTEHQIILLSQIEISARFFDKQIKYPLNIIQSCLGTSLLQKLETFLLWSMVPICSCPKVIFFLIPKVFLLHGVSVT